MRFNESRALLLAPQPLELSPFWVAQEEGE